MTGSTKSPSRRFGVAVAALALVLAACGDDSGSSGGDSGISGKTVTISGPEVGAEADGFTEALAPFETDTGVKVSYSGSRDFETQIRVAAEGGDLPDLAVIPQPGLLKDIASAVTPVPQSVLDSAEGNFSDTAYEAVTLDGKVLGIPNKADAKSLVWYSPKVFAENDYEIPETWEDLLALQETMKQDGNTPWCIGIESGGATGWAFTDWMEDLMLRINGPDVYDQWVSHEIPYNDPKVLAVAQAIGDIWFPQGNALGGRQAIAATGFAAAGLPVADGECMMHRQANFYGANFKDAGFTLGPDGDVNVFQLPNIASGTGTVMLVGGTYIAAFNDKPETLATLKYIASAEYSNARIKANKGGFLSPNRKQDTSLFADELDRTMSDLMVNADIVRFDASDLMPSEVGSGSVWREGTNYVIGTNTAKEFVDKVEASWT